jgi:hemolysin activation/secretion protein
MPTFSRFRSLTLKPFSLACVGVMISCAPSLAAENLATNTVRRPAEIQQDVPVASDLVDVKGFAFLGNSVIGSQELQLLLAGYVGQSCGLQKLREAADKVTAAYHYRGMALARAYIPMQKVESGIVTISIIEGRIGEVIIEGNRNYSEKFIRKFITGGKRTEFLTVERLEKGLLLLNSNFTDLKTTANLSPGKEPGTTDVHIKVEDGAPLHLTLSANNFGAENVSRARYSAQAEWINALFPGGRLAASATLGERSKDMSVYSGSYEFPLNSLGTSVGISAFDGSFDVGKDFAALGIHNKETSGDIHISQSLFKARLSSLTGRIGFRASEAKYYMMDEISKTDNTRVVYAQVQVDKSFWGGRNLLDLTWSQGLGTAMGGSGLDEIIPVSRQNASNDFYRINLGLLRLQPLSDSFSGLLRVSGQWSPSDLLAGEEWLIGGMNSVHGYSLGEASGDKGYSASLSLRVAPLQNKNLLQLAAYVDYGYAYKKFVQIGSQHKNELTGIGFGATTHFDTFVSTDLRLDIGYPLNPSVNFLKERPVIYLETAIRF